MSLGHVQRCSVCNGTSFASAAVLWPELIQSWGLSHEEAAYIDRQQGTHCSRCFCSLRSQALAKAILSAFQSHGTFRRFLLSPRTWLLKILELNGANTLTSMLQRLPRRTLGCYPEVDMQKLPYRDNQFDLVVHSDTLEHVPNPLEGLRECLRVLRPGGWCIYTIPIVVGRLSRSRKGLPPSYHGTQSTGENDMMVHTEYGSNFWEEVLAAGFDECRIVTVEYPSAQAVAARKPVR